MGRMSVKLKVTLWYTVVMIVVSAIVLFAMTSISNRAITRDVTQRLVDVVEDSARHLAEPKDMKPPRGPEMRYYHKGVNLAVFDSEGKLLEGQLPFDVDEDAEFENGIIREHSYNGETFYVLDKEIKTFTGHTLWLRGAISVSAEKYALNSTFTINLILTAILILIASIGGYLIIKRAFVPVGRIIDIARAIIRSEDLSKRIDIGNSKDEISDLANTFDEMLDHIEQSFDRERQFTSDASHELRTPVAVIMSECEYMTDCAKTEEEYKECAQSIKQQTEKMSRLISELLTISRMDKGTLPVNMEETDLSELLSFVCDEQEEIRGSDVRLIRNIPDGITANADKFMIARLFGNLVSNAYQYIGDGSEIRVSLEEANGQIVMTVTDDGIGISEQELPKIWERFYQVDSARTADESGNAGLGLAMVKWIAKAHKGTVDVRSELGKGSVFTFTFPKR